MAKDKKQISAQEQLEMDIMAEAELARLLRQYRIMDGDRRAFEDEALSQLQKQRKIISILTKEHNELLENLKVATSQSNKRKDSEVSVEIQKLLDQHDKFVDLIRKEKVHLREIEFQIKKVKQDVLNCRKLQISEEQAQEKWVNGQKTLETLQNKLDTSVKRFCAVLAENKQLREEIDHLLKERALFNKTWHTYLDDLNTGKKVMMDLIEQATLAYDQREEWGQKLQALRIRAQNDLLLHMSDMRELFRQLDHDANLQDFLSVKGQRRIMKDLEMKEQLKKQQARENMEKKLMHYKETLNKVQEIAGEDDVTKLSAEYVKQEEENFALFNYVNELNHELEMLTDNVANLFVSIDEQKELNEKRAQKQKDTISSLKTELDRVNKEGTIEKGILQEKETELQIVLTGIESIFLLINCDNTPILELLGETGTINNYNVMLYLGLLENRVGEILKQSKI